MNIILSKCCGICINFNNEEFERDMIYRGDCCKHKTKTINYDVCEHFEDVYEEGEI